MPGMKPSPGWPCLSTPWSSRRTPTTLWSSISASDTGVPGQICTVPVLWTWAPTHCMNWPMESTSPPVLWRNAGDQGNSRASCSQGNNPLKARMQASAARRVQERRLAPTGSSR